jgi:hypothetical protein
MVGEPASSDHDQPPTEGDVGNHHWPYVTNIFASHGGKFPEHHNHVGLVPSELRKAHELNIHGGLMDEHDTTAVYHKPENVPGCRLSKSGNHK